MAKCSKCDALFMDTAGLIRHSMMHTAKSTAKSSQVQSASPSIMDSKATKKPTSKDASTETNKYSCDQCHANFDSDEEWEFHKEHSPFHQEIALECYECDQKFNSQIELLQHLDAIPHQARWVLVLI